MAPNVFQTLLQITISDSPTTCLYSGRPLQVQSWFRLCVADAEIVNSTKSPNDLYPYCETGKTINIRNISGM